MSYDDDDRIFSDVFFARQRAQQARVQGTQAEEKRLKKIDELVDAMADSALQVRAEIRVETPDPRPLVAARRIVKPPASTIDAIVRFLYSSKTYSLVFEPLRADLIHDWHDAEVAGDRRKAALIRYVRAPWAMMSHAVLQTVASVLRRIIDVVRAIL